MLKSSTRAHTDDVLFSNGCNILNRIQSPTDGLTDCLLLLPPPSLLLLLSYNGVAVILLSLHITAHIPGSGMGTLLTVEGINLRGGG